ncbi:MAG: hypothetical protein HFG63_04030 [Lachnospiraceae bacterium]|nr:hypothetical protein [Lachnospiraceae bacterium]
MKGELCFCIQGKDLYLEQVLVDYMGVPIFFLCRDEQEYYVALCTDLEEYNYVVIRAASREVYDLLHGKIPMRDIILNQKEYWEVFSGEEVSLDTVRKHETGRLDLSVLPEEKACFKVLTEDMKRFVDQFDDQLFSTKYFCEYKPVHGADGFSTDISIHLPWSGIKAFTNLGDYSFKSHWSPQAVLETEFDWEYGHESKRAVIKRDCGQSECWLYDDVMNAAA